VTRASRDDAPTDTEPAASGARLSIPVGRVVLGGDLVVPDGAPGIVVFAHGSGSSRHSPRNRMVATTLNAAGLGTLLVDLLTPGKLWAEIIERKNMAVALLAGAVAISLSNIIAAVMHG